MGAEFIGRFLRDPDEFFLIALKEADLEVILLAEAQIVIQGFAVLLRKHDAVGIPFREFEIHELVPGGEIQ